MARPVRKSSGWLVPFAVRPLPGCPPLPSPVLWVQFRGPVGLPSSPPRSRLAAAVSFVFPAALGVVAAAAVLFFVARVVPGALLFPPLLAVCFGFRVAQVAFERAGRSPRAE